MQEQTLEVALEREHREIDEGLARIAAGLDATLRLEVLETAALALRRHIYFEEEMLFPALREVGLVAPVVVMLREHGEIWRALDDVERYHASGGDGSTAPDAHDRLVRLLEAHNDKEERILYPATDSLFDSEESARIQTFFESGALPDGWVCAGARDDGATVVTTHAPADGA